MEKRTTSGSEVVSLNANSWHLQIPAGSWGTYRLAQLDDYRGLHRRYFPWHAPLTLTLQARASASNLPGTWGFGLWNDPFSLTLGFGGGARHFPVLPNAAWFFFASPKNYLSLRDDLPANGALAGVFRSAHPVGNLLAALGAPALLLRPLRKLARRIGRRFIAEDAFQIDLDVMAWHTYRINWQLNQVTFTIDQQQVHQTAVSPRAPLGLVLWIDNQYAAFLPDGSLNYGTEAYANPAWIEVSDIQLQQQTEESPPISTARVK